MPSVVGVTLLFAALVVVNCYVIRQVPYEEIRHAKHVNISEDDEFTLSTLIEKANKNLGKDQDEPTVKFGDIATPTGLQNADPCTSRGCKWQKHSDGNVYIPYVISNQYSSRERAVIQQALQSFSTSTCIRFRQQRRESDYLNIRSLGGCYSFIGRRGRSQDVSLSRAGCVHFGIVQHELIHALGFHHEQNRSDRDQHVRILYENVIREQEHNFRRVQTNNLGTPYDYNSVMQYGRFAFSRNGQETIRPIPNSNVSIGRATQMSQNDIDRINRLYQCNAVRFFNVLPTNNLGTTYDYNSAIQYDRFAFSKNGHETIRPILNSNVSTGETKKMSQNDIISVNKLYQCKQYLKKPRLQEKP